MYYFISVISSVVLDWGESIVWPSIDVYYGTWNVVDCTTNTSLCTRSGFHHKLHFK